VWWRDEFLANDRVAERNRQILACANLRRALGEELDKSTATAFGRVPGRRALARLMAVTARAAWSAAARLDPEVRARA
jgi:hypothetical protein